MSQDFYAGFLSGSTFILVCVGIFQIGFNKGMNTAIRIIDNHPAAKKVLVDTKEESKLLSMIVNG